MSKLKLVDDLFLEKAELGRLIGFLTEDGYEKDLLHTAEKFGVVRNRFLDPENKWLRLDTSNTLGVAKLNAGFAIDKNHKRISLPEDITIPIPQDGKWYWLRIEHHYITTEKGTVSIGGSNNGLMTGINTKFTEILRGQPNFPAKIRFANSVNYNLEYEILEVIDDYNALVQGVFENLEKDMNYIVIGTFTPGYYPPEEDKEIFMYDYLNFAVLPEGDNGEQPSATANEQFLICRVKNDSGTLEIQDKRHTCQFKTRDESLLNQVSRKMNPLIGIEYVKKYNYNNDIFYTVGFDWKFNIDNQNLNTTSMLTTITAGKGGAYKSIENFKQGDFDGWRYYYENGEFSTVITSVKNSDNTITLLLDSVKIESGIGICVCPNADEIGIIFNFEIEVNNPYLRDFQYFPINKPYPTATFSESQLSKLNQFCDVKWFVKSSQETSNVFEFNESEYYTEKAYDEKGKLVDDSQKITKQDIFFNGGVDPGNTDQWKQFYPNEYALMYGNNLRVIDATTVASKLFYKFYGSNTVKIQGRINLTLQNDPTTNGGLGPNGILMNTPFKWFDDTVGNRFIRSFVGGIRYAAATGAINFENTRVELFYTNTTSTGEDDPTNKIAIRYLKNGKGMLNDPNQSTGLVTYDNPLPTGASLEFDIDLMIYFDEFDTNYVNGPVGTDNTNPNVASGGLPGITNYTINAQINGGSNGFNVQLTRNTNETNYRVKVDFLILYRSRQQFSSSSGWLFWQHTNYWYVYYDRQVGGSVIFEISELNKTTSVTIGDTAYDLKSVKITGITLI